MAESRKIVRIFLASPGDLSEERLAAKRVIDELNSVWFSDFGYQAELVGWELTPSRFGRPQALINKDLDTCEYFIGLLYKRWGSPPHKANGYTSGFEEEFRRSIARRRKSNKPEMSLFFKEIPANDLQDPGEQLRRVLDFKSEIINGKELLFEQFADLADFECRIRRCVSDYLRFQIKAERSEGDNSSGDTSPQGSLATADAKVVAHPP